MGFVIGLVKGTFLGTFFRLKMRVFDNPYTSTTSPSVSSVVDYTCDGYYYYYVVSCRTTQALPE